MSDTVKLRIWSEVANTRDSFDEEVVDTGISRTDWDAMPEDEKREVGEEWFDGHIENRISGGWEPVEVEGGEG
ncbi:hypothetical protein [Nonomuraea sp. NPDC050786]|uniref:hypothetical protein n=1 Tax=Nonomuraea sp. NPDC050786 TaxID=3154840 RepID=UPI0033FEC1AF